MKLFKKNFFEKRTCRIFHAAFLHSGEWHKNPLNFLILSNKDNFVLPKPPEMRHERSHTKVIATIGPATRHREILEQMIHEGVDVCRINLSHDAHSEHLKTIRFIQELNEELGSQVAILGDLQGPKLRVGVMENDRVDLEDGQEFSFVTTPCTGTSEKAYLSYEKLPIDVTVGERILVDDGKLIFEVISSNRKDTVLTRVIARGPLSNKRGSTFRTPRSPSPALPKRTGQMQNFSWITMWTGSHSPSSGRKRTSWI
jgi:hypothetical protein